MKRSYYLITFQRNGIVETITDWNTHPLIFLKIEKSIGYNTAILFYKELTKAEYEFSIEN